MVETMGLEPTTPRLQRKISSRDYLVSSSDIAAEQRFL